MSKGALGLLAAYWPEDTPRYAHVPLKTLGDTTIYAIAAASPDRVALVSAEGALTFGELAAKARVFGESIRSRVERGSRVAIAAANPAELLIALFGAFEADVLAFPHIGSPPKEVLDAFVPDLVVGENLPETAASKAAFAEIMSGPGKARSGRPDFRTPILAMPSPDGHGETLHSHRTLVATGISIGAFYLLAEDITLLLLEPPTNWCALAMLLGAMNRGATIYAGWDGSLQHLPGRLDYAVCGWDRAGLLLDESQAEVLAGRIAAGLIVGIERPFSTSRRLRLGRRIRADVLTLLGRNDLGPIVGSHPAWFLNDAAGIPLPSVDLRPLNPTDGTPLNIGWEVVDSAELGVKSALAPAGGTVVDGWLRSGLIAQIDPTGFYFLLRDSRARPA
jgi:acyl-CoA synthetase (AMP-forming)/AMP-acid ligase II